MYTRTLPDIRADLRKGRDMLPILKMQDYFDTSRGVSVRRAMNLKTSLSSVSVSSFSAENKKQSTAWIPCQRGAIAKCFLENPTQYCEI